MGNTRRTPRLLALALVAAGALAGGAAGQERHAPPGSLAVAAIRAAMPLMPAPTPTATPEPTVTPEPTATPEPRVRLRTVGTSRLLGPMSHEYQRMNNCGPVAVLMTLSYFGHHIPQAEVAYDLRPSPADVAVGADEAAAYMEEFGLRAVVRVGGDPRLLRRLVANGIPVMTPHLLNDYEDIGHFTVVRGYDTRTGTLVLNDSYYGPERYVAVSEYVRLWEPYERMFVPVYRPEQEPVVRAILGDDWDEDANDARYVREQRAVVDAAPRADTWMSLGYGLYRAGEYGDAVTAYERALAYGLSRRTLWYSAWPATALSRTGRHAEALRLADSALAENPASSEMLLARGRALRGLGRDAEAAESDRQAAEYAPYDPDAREAARRAG
jgi:hypothetical protein